MNSHISKKITVGIQGMHCAACEVLIERKLRQVVGVEHVSVSRAQGQAIIQASHEPRFHDLQNAIKKDGYTITDIAASDRSPRKKGYFQTGAIVLVVVAIYVILKQLKVVPPDFGVGDEMSYGFVFLIGLVAAVSTCMAVTGGLLMTVAAKYNERHPELSGVQRFKPHLYFNVGRVASYTVLGGAVGALGSVLSLSSTVSGIVTILVSIVMVLLGLQLLNIFPWLSRFQPRMPKFIAHRIYGASEGRQGKIAPFLFGASTFFLPCGFTQALQLYVLSKGSFMTGALTMMIFAIGTLPAMMSISAIMSFARGTVQQYVLKVAGVVVVLVGIFNISNGIALARLSTPGNIADNQTSLTDTEAPIDPNVQLENGVQVVYMKVSGYSYEPANFTVQQGIPVEWHVDGTQAAGCAHTITMPSMKLTEFLPSDSEKVIRFTPQATGVYKFSCSMGMTTPGAAFTVVAGSGNKCDPTIMDCVKQ